MNPLLNFNERYPWLTAVVGGTSGVSTWFFQHIEGITSAAACVGTIATAGIAVLTLAVKIAGVLRRRRIRDLDREDDLPWD